jgi:hypothetical protein
MTSSIKTNIKIGDTIYHITGISAIIVDILPSGEYPIKIKYDNDDTAFINADKNDFGIYEWLIVKPISTTVNTMYFIKRPDIKIDDLIEVFDYNRKEWIWRYFAGWGDDGQCTVWRGGASSLTTNGDPYIVSKYRISK